MNFHVNINICRVCMKSDEGVSLLEDKELNEKFVFTTRLKLNASDDMPSLICSKCIKRLRIAYDFVELAHASENNLKAFLIKISTDFQLVTRNKLDKDNTKDEDDDDDLLDTILEDGADYKVADETQELVSAQEDKSTPLKCKTNASKIPRSETYENPEQLKLKKEQCEVKEKSKEIFCKLLKTSTNNEDAEKQSKEYEVMESEVRMDIEPADVENMPKFNFKFENGLRAFVHVKPPPQQEANVAPKNELSTEDEIQALDYTDEESQTELEILEENLQPCEDSRSSIGAIEQQTQSNGGFLKEYQAKLEEDDEYLDDSNSLQGNATANDLSLYEASEELLDDTELEMETMEESHIIEEELETNVAQPQQIAENSETDVKELKGKKRKSQAKAIGRAAANKSGKKVENITPSARFYCFKCNRDFSTKTNLTRHMATHEGKRPFQCYICNKGFTQNVSLKHHMYTHTGEKPYVCDVCHRGFTQCKSLVFHMRRHTGEKPFPCEKCGALFRQKDGLKTHILKRHTITSQHGNTELITCAICKKVLPDKYSLQVHMKKHLNDYVRVDSAMSCASREAMTDENSDMLLELIDDDLLHDKSAVFMSDSVSESADDIGTSAHVVDLMTTSALEPSRAKKFQCRKCYKCFAIKKNLLRHLTTHDITLATEEFPCKLCGFCYASSEELRVHILSEHNSTGELYQCDLCQTVFSSLAKLREHSTMQHTFKCHQCPNIQFTSRRLLTGHMGEHEFNEIKQ